MLGWTVLAMEGWIRRTPARTHRLMKHVPLWGVRWASDAKLVRTLRHVWRNSPAQRKRWENCGVRLRNLRSPEVLRRIPFTTSSDIAEHPEDYFCVAPGELIHVLSTSGTKGVPKKVYLTADDFDRQVQLIATQLRGLPGATRAAVTFNTEFPTWSAGPVARRGVEAAGMFGILAGARRSVPEQIQLIKEYEINTLLGLPAYIHRITVEAAEDLRRLGVRYILLGAQPWTEEFRRMLEAAWGAKVIDVYGSTECVYGIAAECIRRNGLHIPETDLRVEIIKSTSGEVLPDGEEGEVVVTTLSRRGMPLVRYRTGDLAHLLAGHLRCGCGLPLRKMSRVRGRVDDVIILGGENVYPDEFDRALLSVPGVTDYQLVVEKESFRDVLHLAVETERREPHLRDVLSRALVKIPQVEIGYDMMKTLTVGGIEFVPPGALSAGRTKTVRIIDRRNPALHPSPTAAGLPAPQ